MIASIKAIAVVASLFVLSSTVVESAETASPDDTARFLAGMPPSDQSPLAQLTQDRTWQQHARYLNSAFGELDRRQLAKIRAWSAAKLTAPSPAMFYMFSGPDFLYANAFFPSASTYVLAALEPVGPVPDLMQLPRGSVWQTLGNIHYSLRTVMSYSFFITADMKRSLRGGRVNGTLPVLYVFLARSGKTIRDVSLVKLDQEGLEHPDGEAGVKSAARGVKIVFAGDDGRAQTLYYFSTNLANDGVRSSGFLKFCEKLGPADSFVKSASYLLHSGNFSVIRDFMLARSARVLQDDSGIPASYFAGSKWQLQPYGRYSGPISIFAGHYQPRLHQVFQKERAGSIDFGIGYRWRSYESNMLLAVKANQADARVETGAVGEKAAPGGLEQATLSAPEEKTPPRRSRSARGSSHSASRTGAGIGRMRQGFWQGFWYWQPRYAR